MSHAILKGGAALAILAAALAGGYWAGSQKLLPDHLTGMAAPKAPPAAQAVPAQAGRAVIYYKDPTGRPDFSPEPKKDEAGRDYLPVYEGEEAALPAPAPVQAEAPKGRGRILYYRNPMGLPDTSPVPKKDPMGMDYVPVYEGDDDGGTTVRVSPDRVQTLGVRTETAALAVIARDIRAVGTVVEDESRQYVVAPKFEGYVERLFVDTTGRTVKPGEILMEVYSPDLVLAQEEYLSAKQGLALLGPMASDEARQSAAMLVEGALTRLRNWDIPRARIERLRTSGQITRTLPLATPAGGIVMTKSVIQGQRFMPGEVLFRIADLSTVWVLADVFERDLALLRPGQDARVAFDAFPGETFTGKVTFVYPTLNAETRTAKVRIALPNPDGRLKPALYGRIDIAAADRQARPVLTVPTSAVIDSGTRQVVLVERGEGRFEPRAVRLGARGEAVVEITQGLAEGEKVVVSANFLIDAESNLKAALQSFQAP